MVKIATKKYELVNYNNTTKMYQIKAIKAFSNVAVGELGGYIQHEHNLSHKGDCWIYDDAQVFEDATVSGNAIVHDNAKVYGHAKVSGNAEVFENAQVYDYAQIKNCAQVFEDTHVCGKTIWNWD